MLIDDSHLEKREKIIKEAMEKAEDLEKELKKQDNKN